MSEQQPPEFKPLAEMADFTERTPGLGGRPSHAPTEQTRALVALMSGMGATQGDIVLVIGIDQKTLRKHYEHELNAGRPQMDVHFYTAMYKGISKGKTDLIKYYGDRRVAAFKPDPERPADVSVSIQMTVDDILKRIDGKTTGIPKFNKTIDATPIEQEPPVDAK